MSTHDDATGSTDDATGPGAGAGEARGAASGIPAGSPPADAANDVTPAPALSAPTGGGLVGRLRGWRAAIRIARRDALRAKGRSALVLSMIMLPIMGVGALDITLRSGELSTEEGLVRLLGTADARVTDGWTGGRPLLQAPDPRGKPTADPAAQRGEDAAHEEIEPLGRAAVEAALPPGAEVLEDRSGFGRARTRHGLLYTQLRELDAADPAVRGMLTLDRGRFPERAGEVAATKQFLEESGLHVGSAVEIRDRDRRFRIVGAYEIPGELGRGELLARPDALLGPPPGASGDADRGTDGGKGSGTNHGTDGGKDGGKDGQKDTAAAGGAGGGDAAWTDVTREYLVSLPGGFTWDMVERANVHGVTMVSRSVVLDPPPDSAVPFMDAPEARWVDAAGDGAETEVLAAAVTIVGLAMLEICLLAGPAFAVGARRSRRQLGLVGANGGDRRHIRAVVLAGGLVIGAAAGALGLALALLLTLAFRPLIEEWVGSRFDGIELPPLELGAIALLAVLTGLASALVPAVTAARQSVLSSLTGRRGVRRTGRALPLAGLAAVLFGTGLALVGAVRSDSVFVVVAGSAIAELGVVAMTPVLVGAFGRLGRWLPLSPRLALRDAVRNRGRTAPAVAAVLAAVAGTVAVVTYMAGEEQGEREQYEAQLPYGAVSTLQLSDGGRDRDVVAAAAERHLPVSARADLDIALLDGEQIPLVLPEANTCPLYDGEPKRLSRAEVRELRDDWRCNAGESTMYEGTPLVGGPAVLKSLGVDDPAAERALAAGRTVVADQRYLVDGEIRIGIEDDPEADPGGPAALPARAGAAKLSAYGIDVLIPPAAAERAGLTIEPYGSFFTTDRMPGSQDEQAFQGALDDLGVDTELYVERGYESDDSLVLLALLVFAGLITTGAAGIATGLAQADAEADLRTLDAVGAAPRVRRTLSGLQCALVAAMGVVLGTAAGVLPAIGLRLAEEQRQMEQYWQSMAQGYGWSWEPNIPIVVPWDVLGLLLVAVPLGAGALAALLTRSRPVLVRRADG